MEKVANGYCSTKNKVFKFIMENGILPMLAIFVIYSDFVLESTSRFTNS